MTTSTNSCVSARSGAENQTKVTQVTSPAPPSRIERGKPVELGLPRGAERACRADGPDQRKHGIHACGRQIARPEAP